MVPTAVLVTALLGSYAVIATLVVALVALLGSRISDVRDALARLEQRVASQGEDLAVLRIQRGRGEE